jgi:ABC-type multidrug transport system ATPase subunit
MIKFENARIDVGGAPLISGLTLEEPGPHVALVGGWNPWFRLLSADASLAAGSAELCGMRAEAAVREGVAGIALYDPPLPPRMRVGQYLEIGAALRGATHVQSQKQAVEVLELLELPKLATRSIGDLSQLERRGLSIAYALLGSPQVLCLETPLSELDVPAKAVVAALIDKVMQRAKLVVSVSRPQEDPAERALLDRLGRVLVLERGALAAQGTVEEVVRPSSRYSVTVSRQGEAFVTALRSAGASVEAATAPRLAAAILGTNGAASAERFVVELGEGQTSQVILQAAVGAQAPLIELLPLGLDARR